MKEEPVPFDKFARIGIYPKDLERMPEDLRDKILRGEFSPLMRLNVPVGDNSAVSIPMKIQLAYDKDGKLQLLTYQIHREIDNRLGLNDVELDRLRKGAVFRKEFAEGDNRKMRYVQLDKETNSLMTRDLASVKFEDKLAEVDKVKDISLGLGQKEAVANGRPVELEVGDQKVTVGVDLREPQGFKVVNGDMEEWKRQQAIRYDDANEGFIGYVQTDENRWEYKQVVDKLQHEERLRMTDREKKEEKKQGLKM
ncbi:hypothetical protein PRBRB14_21520 [Hallella multisaccharivorax DSM 17128]|uniref:DUF4099 domain-containing protein n=1 Tax=Hallella multisaccharivorax DSM 17128 TaxID=688246 RepID=F8N7M1_9BACT|nr:DUF4099 domain-containing protein [Hallella multisaccharivorax]EGN57481.1 hypothetical protein Premu_2087 [Hallella multisaccharivorax DSM 17128]GJG31273.1 hypothetical protein PRBRB14_21520 [Hallella multisaccharivorax DSM 17128]